MKRPARQRSGKTAVEFALGAPLLILLVFGSWDFARANMMLHTIDNAAYEGCRRGVVPGASANDVRAAANQVLDAAFIQGAVVTVTPATLDAQTPEVTVAINVPMDQNAWIASYFLADHTFNGTYTLRREKFETVTLP